MLGDLFLALFTGFAIGVTSMPANAATSISEGGPACSEGGYMLVMGGVEDRSKVPDPERAATYGPAVWNLVESYGAFYVARATPTKVYEGEWPDWKAVVISKWPCRETGKEFWYSDAYQNEVKPLRKNAGVYDVGLFDAGPEFPPADVQDLVPETCSNPLLVLALTKPTDLEAYGAYDSALIKTGLGFRAGLKFLFTGRPTEVLEGTWPEGYGVLVSTYPCREAWEAFYYGETYQSEIKPLREGAGDVIIVGLEPERVE